MKQNQKIASAAFCVAFGSSLSFSAGAQEATAPAVSAPAPAAPVPSAAAPAPAAPAPATTSAAEAPAPAASTAPSAAAVAPVPSAPVPSATPSSTVAAAPELPPDPALDSEADAAAAELNSQAAADAQAEEEAALAEEEAAMAELMGGDDEGEDLDEYKLNIYGFTDVAYSSLLFDSFDGYGSTFSVGRLNLYIGAELGDEWRTLSEVRFTYLPHGSTPATAAFGAPVAPTNTTVADYVDYGRPSTVGGVIIERAWLEKTVHPLLNIRMGHWLTPYGIWNVDHGSPVILGVTRPYAVGEALFPESQTGVQLFGSTFFDALKVGYNLSVSNGRGPIDKYRDLDDNKAIGWRAFASYDSKAGEFSVGTSGYLGDYSESTAGFEITADGGFEGVLTTDKHYKEQSTAFDAKWTYGGALIQSELIINDTVQDHYPTRYTPAGPFGPEGYTPDNRKFGVYSIGGYRFEYLGIMPWIGYERYDTGPAGFFADGVNELYVGLNIRPTPRVVLKGQYIGVHTVGTDLEDRINIGNIQIAWSF